MATGRGISVSIEDLRARALYARGSDEPEVVRSIRRQTEDALARGYYVGVMEKDCIDEYKRLRGARGVMGFFGSDVGSRITLMDLVDMADVAFPLARIEGITVCQVAKNSIRNVLDIYVKAGESNGSGSEFEMSLRLYVSRGLGMRRMGIFLGEKMKHQGAGARWLLCGALFAARHGIESWRTWIGREGLRVWSKFGAEVEAAGVWRALRSLEMLADKGLLDGFESRKYGSRDLEEIASITVDGLDDEKLMALNEWVGNIPLLNERDRALMVPPYPVGALALTGAMVSANFRTGALLDRLLFGYLPGRISREANPAIRAALEGSHARGMAETSLLMSMGFLSPRLI